ncbi:MAG: hypothetical protein ACPGSK_05795, partial [Alphaproteobacteria bacterium]
AAAFESLFMASGGGGIGLFTAIRRLRAVYDRIRTPLEESGLPLFAQHVDAMDTGTLVDIFRDDTNACLLGTDAVRDGAAFEMTLTFNRAVGELTLPVNFEVDETGVYGFAEIDMGAPKALAQDYEWISPEGEGGSAADPASNGG